MRLRIPIFVKVIAPLLAVLLVTTLVSGFLVYQEGAQRRRAELDLRLQTIAAAAADRVDRAALQAIQTPSDQIGPEYAAVQAQLVRVRDAGVVDWVGIYRREEDRLYYWVDSDATGMGYPFFYPTAAHLAAFDDPEQPPMQVEYTDEFGAYYGYAAPLVAAGPDGQPQVIGLVEALIYGERLALLQQETRLRVGATLIGGGIVGVLLSLLAMIFTFNRPMRRLQEGALDLAGGDLGATIDLRSNDELGDLAGAFNQMSAQLKVQYDEVAQRNTEMEMVYQIAQAITASSNDPAETLATILDRAQQMIPFEEGEICLYVPEENALRVRGWKGKTGSIDWRERKYPLGQGFTGGVGQSRRSFLSADITQEPSVKPIYGEVMENPVRSYVGVPLLVADRLVGTMQLVSTEAGQFDEHSRQLLETIALQAAVAIETAQKVEARETELKAQIAQLKIEVDEAKRARQVAEVTETEFFAQLQQQAQGLRQRRGSRS
jgi:putative methionine-R-sulfoxide reductase with GAF domain